MCFISSQKRRGKVTGNLVLPIKTRTRNTSQRVIPSNSPAFYRRQNSAALQKGEILLADHKWKKWGKEIKLEDKTPTLMRNRLSNALFNYVRAVSTEACSLAEAIKCQFIVSFFFQIYTRWACETFSSHCLKFPLVVPKKAPLPSFLLRNVKSTPASSPSIKTVLSTNIFHMLFVKRNIMSSSPSCWPSNLSGLCGFIARQPSGSVCPFVLLLAELSSPLKLLLTQFFSTKWACDSSVLFQGLSYCFINQTVTFLPYM